MFLIFFFSGRAAYRVYENRADSATAADEKQKELTQLEDRYKYLSQELRRLNTTDGKESEFRKKFGVGLPGENVAIIVEANSTSSDSITTSLWQKIKEFFTKN